MTTVVTGASGTVGRSLVAQLLEAGEPVRAVTRNPAAARFPPGVEVLHGDLAAPATLQAALEGAERLRPPATTPTTSSRSSRRWRRPGWSGPTSAPASSRPTGWPCGGRPSGPSGWSAGRGLTRSGSPSTRPTGDQVRLEPVSREEALRLLTEQGGWAAANGPFLLGYDDFR